MRHPLPSAAALAAALALLAGGTARAQADQKPAGAPPPAAAVGGSTGDLRVAYVDLQRALNEVEDGKVAKASLEREFKEKQKLLEDKKNEFDRARADFEKQSVVMSEDARKERQTDLERKQFELQQLLVQLQKEFSEKEQNLTRGIFDKMSAVVREIADQEGLALVLRADMVVFATPSLDITNELVRKYNARHKPTSSADGKKPAAPSAAADKKGGGKKK